MAVFNAGYRFRARKRRSLAIFKLPKNVREAFNIERMYKNGMAKLEPGKKNCLYDRCYVFEEVNYINRDDGEKESFLNQFMAWLKTMNVDFKITVANEYQSIEEFLESVRCMTNRSLYPEIGEGIDRWTMEKLEDSNPNVTTLRYLTVSCRAASLQDARVVFNALDTTIQAAFSAWQARIVPLDAEERLTCIHSLLCPGKKRDEEFIMYGPSHDWKNDIYPRSIRTYSNYMVTDGDTWMSVLFGWKYRGSIDPDTFIRSFSNMEFPSYITMDFAPVPPDEISDFLTSAGMNVEKSISDEEEYKRRKNIIGTGPSYARQRKKDEVESLQDQIAENDETGFFMNLLMVVTAPDEETLAQRVSKYKAIGRKEGVVMETANWQQLKALNTALPIGGRQVDYMRFFLSSSVAAFQPFYAQDIIESGGYMYGLNRATKRLILGNRKLLMNPHGIIIGHTGSGKSFHIKYTEISQTLVVPIAILATLVGFTIALFTGIGGAVEDTEAYYMGGGQDLVDVAVREIGYREGADGSNKYGKWCGIGNANWCHAFVSWCANECGYIKDGTLPKTGSCESGRQWFIKRDEYQKKGDYEPQPGDIVYFRHGSETESHHVGIVEFVENGILHTIEGNSGGMVRRRKYPLDADRIMGYGTPAYPDLGIDAYGSAAEFLKKAKEIGDLIVDDGNWVYSNYSTPRNLADARKGSPPKTNCARAVSIIMQEFGTLKKNQTFYAGGGGKLCASNAVRKRISQYY